jgi:hypothetical protein
VSVFKHPPMSAMSLAVALVIAVVGGLGVFGVAQVAFGQGSSDPSFVPHADACVNKYSGTIRVVTSSLPNCISSVEKPFLIASEEKVDAVATRVAALEEGGGGGGAGEYYVRLSPFYNDCGNTGTNCQTVSAPVEVDCDDANDIATGGGHLASVNPDAAVGQSQPKGFGPGVNVNDGEVPHGWRVGGDSDAYAGYGLIAYVICLSVPNP